MSGQEVRRSRREALLYAALLGALAVLPGAVAEDVTTDVNRNATLDSGRYADFHVSVPQGKEASIYVVSTGTVDFYIMSESVFGVYKNPFNDFFIAERAKERANDFSHTLSESGKVVVIDNAAKSASGANPTGPVSYTIRVTYRDAVNPIVVCGVGLIILAAIFVVSFLIWNRRQQARERAAPRVPPLEPPPPDDGA